jgi:hypothetical protein
MSNMPSMRNLNIESPSTNFVIPKSKAGYDLGQLQLSPIGGEPYQANLQRPDTIMRLPYNENAPMFAQTSKRSSQSYNENPILKQNKPEEKKMPYCNSPSFRKENQLLSNVIKEKSSSANKKA